MNELPMSKGAKSPCMIVFPVVPGWELSKIKVLPAPMTRVAGSTVADEKHVPPLMVAVPVAENKPWASGPVWVSVILTWEVAPPLELK